MKILILNSKTNIKPYFDNLGLPIQVDYKTLDVKPPLVKVGTMKNPDGEVLSTFSPDVIEYVRDIVKPNEYNYVLWCYRAEDYPENQTTGGKAYAYPHLYLGTHLATVRMDGNELSYSVHELHHLFCFHLNKLGFSINDEMDSTLINGVWYPYYKNFTPTDPDSNHMRTWRNIEPYKKYLDDFPPVLRQGMRSPWITQLQIRLNELGYWSLSITGFFGINTLRTIKDFQKKKGLVVDGIVGVKTLEALEVKKKPKLSLIDALLIVESRGDDNAVGDKTLKYPAYGALQIRQPLVDDVNKIFKTSYKSQDCLGNRKLSLWLFEKYFEIYNHNKTDEQKARAWNGGGNWQKIYGKKGYEKYSKNLDIYWEKVKKHLA